MWQCKLLFTRMRNFDVTWVLRAMIWNFFVSFETSRKLHRNIQLMKERNCFDDVVCSNFLFRTAAECVRRTMMRLEYQFLGFVVVAGFLKQWNRRETELNRKVKIIKCWMWKGLEEWRWNNAASDRDRKEVSESLPPPNTETIRNAWTLAFWLGSKKNTWSDNRDFCFFCFGHFRLHQSLWRLFSNWFLQGSF